MIPDVILWGVLGTIGIAYLVWVLFSAFIARRVGGTNARKALLTLILVPAPLVYVGASSWHDNYKWRHAKKLESELVAKTLNHLSHVCGQEEYFKVHMPFAREAGVFFRALYDVDHRLILGGQRHDEKPITGNRLLSSWHGVQEWWYGNIFSPSEADRDHYQVNWHNGIRLHSILKILGADSFVETGGSDGLKFTEHRQFLTHVNEPSPRQDLVSHPVAVLKAKYELLSEDVSTFEDRRNWIARTRMRLVDRKTSGIVAEYLGFSANLAPMRYGVNERPWQLIRVCPNEVQDSQLLGEPWDAGRFFFSKLVNSQSVQR